MRKNIGPILGRLADIYFGTGRLTESIEYMRQAIQIAQELDDVQKKGFIFESGKLYTKLWESYQKRLIPTPEPYRFFKD